MADRILKLTNGKEINLSNLLGEVKEKDFLGQNKKIFNIFDANKDKTIDFEESYYIGNILLDFISRFDGEEKDLSENEINLLKSFMPELKDLKNEEITSFIAKLYETIQLKNTSKFTSEYLNDYAVNNLNMVEEVSEGGVFDKLGWMISQYFDEKPINIEEYESKVKHTQTKAKHLLKAKDLGLNLYNDVYKTYTNKEFSVEEAQKFEQKALRFLQVRELKHKKEQLKKDLSRVKRAYEQEETANKIAHPLSRANAMPKLDWRTEFGNAVSNFFGNDEKLKEIMLKEMAPNFSTNASKKEIYTILNNFQKMVDELYTNTLADEKYETIEKEYKEAFKLIYGEEEISDEIYEKISSSLQIGGLAQIGLVITLQIVLTKLTAGTATVALEALKAKYGLTAVQNAVRLLSATNTVALDYGVKVLNELTSKNGLSEKDINTINSGIPQTAAFIFFGSYISAPMASRITNLIKTQGVVSKAFESGIRSTQNDITTTSLTGQEFIKALNKHSSSLIGKVQTGVAHGVGFSAEIASFAMLDMVMQNTTGKESLENSAKMLTKIKIMGYVLNAILGRTINWSAKSINEKTSKAMDLSTYVEKSYLDKMTINEIKTPNGKTTYSITIDGQTLFSTKNSSELTIKLVNHISSQLTQSEKLKILEKYEETAKKIQEAREIFGFSSDEVITPEKIKETYRKLIKQTHADKGGSDEAFVKVQEAYENLSMYLQLAFINDVKAPSAKPKSNPTTVAEVKPETGVVPDLTTKVVKSELTTSPIKKLLPDFIESKKDLLFKESDIDATVANFINHYSKQADGFREGLEYSGFTKLGTFLSRVKGEYSLRDKIKNYLKDNPKATYLDIWKEVRDCFGARTVIENLNYKDYPEVVDIVNKGDLEGAKRRMAEIQTEPFVIQFKEFINQNANGENKLTTARISNYVSEDGIPYLSERQLAEMKDYAGQKGVELEIFEKISNDDPKYAEMKAVGYKSTTKAQPSGYTALQINFKNANGDVMEWQFRGKLVNEFAEAEHLPYDLRTSKDVIGAHPELEPLYNPLKEILSEDNMPKDVYKQYNKYLTAYYEHLRNLELGFESTPPKLSDYEINGFKFDPRLEAENLIKLSVVAQDLKILSTINERGSNDKYKKLYAPIQEAYQKITAAEKKQYYKYVKDYCLNSETKYWDYAKQGLFLSKTLSIENLKLLDKLTKMIDNNEISVNHAIQVYHKKVVGLELIKPENRFSITGDEIKDLCVKQENIIKELDKIENIECFCEESFKLLKKQMGLEDSGIELKIITGKEGGYYDVVTNTIYINKDWAGVGSDITSGKGIKSEIFGDIAHELTHARQWIEILRNGWLEDYPEWLNAINQTDNGKYLLFYTKEIGINESSFEKSLFDLNNWQDYKEPYKVKEGFDKEYLKDTKGNYIIADINSKEYQDYINQPVEKEAFDIGNIVVDVYKNLTFNNKPRKISTDIIKSLFNNDKIDTKNHWYKCIDKLLKEVRTDNYKIDISPELTKQDYEILTMLVNLKDGQYYDIWKSKGKDGIPNIEKLALFVRTMRLTHQTLDYANFDIIKWDLVVQDIINKPEDLILPVLEYKIDSTEINNALSDKEKKYLKDPILTKKIESLTNYLNCFNTKEEILVFRGDIKFDLFKNSTLEDGRNIYKLLLDKTNEFHQAYISNNYDNSKVKIVEDLFNKSKQKIFVTQSRFLSTAMEKDVIEKFAKSIEWHLTVKAGTSGISIESYNIERVAESEFLINKDSILIIQNIKYNPEKNNWTFEAFVIRPPVNNI